jgi:RHS repeat-associated protein
MWAYIVEIIETILEYAEIVAEYAKRVWNVIGYLNTINSLNRPGGPEAFLQGVLRSYLIGTVVNAIRRGVSDTGASVPDSTNGDIGLVEEFGQMFLERLNPVPVFGDFFQGAISPQNRRDLFADVDAALVQCAKGHRVAGDSTAVPDQVKAKGGDPVLLHFGAFLREATDLRLSGAGMDFNLLRTYRSNVGYRGPLGECWTHSYDQKIRVDGQYVISRLRGDLTEQRYIAHPDFSNAPFAYYIPPNGVHEVIVPDGVGSFQLLTPELQTYAFEVTAQPEIHRLRSISDRLGNELRFKYDVDDRLEQIFINSQYRYVSFQYDTFNRVSRVTDHAGRIVTYAYDDWGFLRSVTSPTFSGKVPNISEVYEYTVVGRSRQLAAIFDSRGRFVIENEYDVGGVSGSFGRLSRQRQNQGESYFVYLPSIAGIDDAVPIPDRVTSEVLEYNRSGHEIRRRLNFMGLEVLRTERLLDRGNLRRITVQTRYNADGSTVARLEPDGTLRQYLYGREEIERVRGPWPDIDHVIADVPINERLSFGKLLAEVTRARRFSIESVDEDGVNWDFRIPNVRGRDRPDDRIVKYRYDRFSGLVISQSDPRYTQSADPNHVESADLGSPLHNPADAAYVDHQRHLTRFEYGPNPRFELRRIIFPNRTRPNVFDGLSVLGSITEKYISYDTKGRLLKRIDANGHEWFNEYYGLSSGPKEGHLLKRLTPHVDWKLNREWPTILEVQFQGNWTSTSRYFVASGAINEGVSAWIEGVQITLSQSTDSSEIVSTDTKVAVSVDGRGLAPWDQSSSPSYIISGLPSGIHKVTIQSTSGVPVALGRIQSHISTEFVRDALGNVTKQVNCRGHAISIVVDSLGRQESISRGSGAGHSTTEFTYDSDGNCILERREWRDESGAIRPEIGVIKSSRFGAFHLLTHEFVGPEFGGQQRLKRYRYDVEDQVTHFEDARNMCTRYDFDELNRQVRTTRASCSPDTSVVRTAYDAAGRVMATWGPRGAQRINGFLNSDGEWVSGLDTQGRARIWTDPLGHLHINDFNKSGGVTVERRFLRKADGTFDLVTRTSREFDEHGSVVRTLEWNFSSPLQTAAPIAAPDAEFRLAELFGVATAETWETYYDAYGNVLGVKRPEGGVERKQYDAQGHLFDSTDTTGRRIFRILDGNGNVTRTYTIDPVKNRQTGSILRNEVFVANWTFDELDREVSFTDQYGNQWQKAYDNFGNLVRTIDPLGNVVRFEYSAFGEQIAVIQERTSSGIGGGAPIPPVVISREYDKSGNLVAIVDQELARTEFSYDSLDRLVETRLAVPGGPIEKRTYDASSNLRSITTRSGLVHLFDYDILDRNIRIDIDASNVSASDLPSAHSETFRLFDYDILNGLIRHENDYSRTDIIRDSRGNPIDERVQIKNIPGAPAAQRLQRTFDLEGRRTELTYPGGRKVRFSYFPSGLLASIRNVLAPSYPGRATNAGGFTIARYGYAGPRATWAMFGNGVAVELLYDGRGIELERRVKRASGSTLWRQQRVRDGASHVRADTVTTATGSRKRAYQLDSLYRLTSYADLPATWLNTSSVAPLTRATVSSSAVGQARIDAFIASMPAFGGTPIYTYDKIGNRLATSEPGAATIASIPNNLNQYTQVDGVSWTYDSAGNLRTDGAYRFDYDVSNLLTDISDFATGNVRATLYRDALGRVIAESSASGIKFRNFDGMDIITEMHATGVTEFAPGASGTSVHVAHNGEDYWIVRDSIRSLRIVLDSGGSMVECPDYAPFGAVAALSCAFTIEQFGGMVAIADLPFLNSLHRTYRPDMGRFFQVDPIGLADDLNMYAYAYSNPVEQFDPFGLAAKLDIDLKLKIPNWTDLVDPALETADWSTLVMDLALSTLEQDWLIRQTPEALETLKWASRGLGVLGMAIDSAQLGRAIQEGNALEMGESGLELSLGIGSLAFGLSPWLSFALKAGFMTGEGIDAGYTSLFGTTIGETYYALHEATRTEERYFVPPGRRTTEVYGSSLGKMIVTIPIGPESNAFERIEATRVDISTTELPGYWTTRQIPGTY